MFELVKDLIILVVGAVLGLAIAFKNPTVAAAVAAGLEKAKAKAAALRSSQ